MHQPFPSPCPEHYTGNIKCVTLVCAPLRDRVGGKGSGYEYGMEGTSPCRVDFRSNRQHQLLCIMGGTVLDLIFLISPLDGFYFLAFALEGPKEGFPLVCGTWRPGAEGG